VCVCVCLYLYMCMCVCVMCSWSGAQVSLSFDEIEGTYGTMRCHSLVAFRLQPCPYLGVHASYSPLVCPSLSPPSAISRAVICLVTTVSESFAHETSQIISGPWDQREKGRACGTKGKRERGRTTIWGVDLTRDTDRARTHARHETISRLDPQAFPFSLVRSGVPFPCR
jgi:hypothetical protein